MKKNIYTVSIAIFVIQINSCTLDKRTDVAIIENNLRTNILIIDQPDEILTDSSLYYDYLTRMEIGPKESVTVSIPGAGFQQATNNEKVFIYVFADDSLVKYKNRPRYEGIVKKSLIKKFNIQLNQIKYPLDTVKVH